MSVIFLSTMTVCIISLSPFSNSGGHRSKSVFLKSRNQKRSEIPVATDTWISGSRFPMPPPEPSRKISHYRLKTCWMIICINHSAGFFFSVYTELYLFSSTQTLLSAFSLNQIIEKLRPHHSDHTISLQLLSVVLFGPE